MVIQREEIISVNVMEKAAVNILIIKIRNLGSMKKTAREFIMQAVIMRRLQDLKSLTELRKNPHTLSEADSVHLRQHAFL